MANASKNVERKQARVTEQTKKLYTAYAELDLAEQLYAAATIDTDDAKMAVHSSQHAMNVSVMDAATAPSGTEEGSDFPDTYN